MRALWMVVAGVVFWPTLADAQFVDDRYRVSISGGLQGAGSGITQTLTITKNVENTTLTAVAPFDRAVVIDGGGWGRIRGRFGARVAFSRMSRTADARVSGTIPHPFYYEHGRAISGTQPGADERESALHVDLAVLAAATPTLELTVFAGPTWFWTSQDLVTNVSYSESYPYDTATYSSAALVSQSATKAGVNAGADITWFMSEHLGVGGLIRFSRATVTYSAGTDNSASARVGGMQATAGLRVSF